MPELAPFFKAEGDGAKVAELKTIYNTIRETITDLPAPGTKDAMIQALREYETTHQDRCRLLPSKDEFYGITKGKNRLEKYLQWVFVPAVKDASTEQTEQRNSALGQLLARTVRAKTKCNPPAGSAATSIFETGPANRLGGLQAPAGRFGSILIVIVICGAVGAAEAGGAGCHRGAVGCRVGGGCGARPGGHAGAGAAGHAGGRHHRRAHRHARQQDEVVCPVRPAGFKGVRV